MFFLKNGSTKKTKHRIRKAKEQLKQNNERHSLTAKKMDKRQKKKVKTTQTEKPCHK